MNAPLSAVLSLLLAAPAAAAVKPCPYDAAAWGLGALPLGSRWVDDHADLGWGFGARMRRRLDENWSLGVSYENFKFGDSEIRVQPVLLSAGRALAQLAGGTLDLHAGAGGSSVRRVERDTKWRIGTRWGLGWERPVTERLAALASLDHHWAAPGGRGRREVHALALAVGVAFGAGRAQEPAVAAAPAPQPADDDTDGVPNPLDRCPNTPAGAAVTAYGCLKTDKVEIRLNVVFETGKDEVRPQFDAQLKEAADFLKAYPEVTAAIEGHTDDVGDEAMNLELSRRRAVAVRQALLDRFGADAARLTAEGFGETRPVAGNDSDEGRAQNRRVVAVFSAQ